MGEPSTGPVTPTLSRRSAIPETGRDVVVDEPDALHERVDDRRAHEPEAAAAQVGRERVRDRRGGRDRARRGRRTQPRRRRRHDRVEIGGERAAPRRPWPGTPPRCRSSRRSWRRLRTMPASAISRSRSASSKPATTRGSKPRNAVRNASRLRRIVDHDSPAWNDSSASRSKSSRSSATGVPHSRSWYSTIRGSGFGPSAPAQAQRGRSIGMPARIAATGWATCRRACCGASGRPAAARR